MMLRLTSLAVLLIGASADCDVCVNGGSPKNMGQSVDSLGGFTCSYAFLNSNSLTKKECEIIQSPENQVICGCEGDSKTTDPVSATTLAAVPTPSSAPVPETEASETGNEFPVPLLTGVDASSAPVAESLIIGTAQTAPPSESPSSTGVTVTPGTNAPVTVIPLALPTTSAPVSDPETFLPVSTGVSTEPASMAPGTTTAVPGTTAPANAILATTVPGAITPGTNAPLTISPATLAPGSIVSGTTAPGTTPPGTTPPGTTPSETTPPGTTSPGTTPPGTTPPGTTPPGTTPPGTTPPATIVPETAFGTLAPTLTAFATLAPGTAAPVEASTLEVPECTELNQDPYEFFGNGSFIPCCDPKQQCLDDWNNNTRAYYRCMDSCDAPPDVPVPDIPEVCTASNSDPYEVYGNTTMIPCCNPSKQCLNNWDGDNRFYFICINETEKECPEIATSFCSTENVDPFERFGSGEENECCTGLSKCLDDWNSNNRYYYRCMSCCENDRAGKCEGVKQSTKSNLYGATPDELVMLEEVPGKKNVYQAKTSGAGVIASAVGILTGAFVCIVLM